MIIYGIDDNKLLDAILTESAEHEQELGKSDFVRLSWESDTKVTIPTGAYIVPFTDGLKYRLLDNYMPSETDKGFRYEPEFQHPLMWLGRVPFLYVTKDQDGNDIKQQEWSFDGLTVTALEYACKAINEAFNITDEKKKFTYTLCGNVDASVSFSISSNDILSVLSSIAQACKTNVCEWHLSWEHKALYFGQVSINLGEKVPLLKVHNNIQTASVSESKESYYNCFYPQGSTKNMSRKALVGTGNVATLARLGLNKEKYPDGCIYIGPDGKVITKAEFDASNAIKQTLALSFDDVYPHIDLYVYSIRKRTRYIKNSHTNEIELDSKGNKKIYTIWYMRLAYCTTVKETGKTPINTTVDKDEHGKSVTHYWYDYEIDRKKQILQGYTLKGMFKVNTHTTNNQYDALSQSLVGQPNGQDGFEMSYHDEENHDIPSSSTDGDSGVSVLKGDYEIVMYQSGDTIIPTNEDEGLIPHGNSIPDLTCNIVVLFNIVMGDAEIISAQEELASCTIQEINRRVQDNNNYTSSSNPVAFAENNPSLYIGQKVTFDDGQGCQLNTRVIKLVTKSDNPIIQEITVGNQIIKGTISQLKEGFNNILSGNFSGGWLNNEQVSAIVQNYTMSRFLRKDVPDIAQEIITFLKGIILGRNYSIDGDGNAILNLIKSVGIENTGDIITKNLTVTGMMKVFKLIIDEAKSAGGALIMTPADGFTVDKVVPVGTDGAELKSTEEIFNLFTVGGKYIGVEDGALADIRTVHKEVDESKVAGYRLYWKATDGNKARRNMWKVGDQALCKTDNLADGTTYNAANKEYWCAVTDRNQDGKPVSVEIDGQLYDCNYITISTTNKLKDCVVNPAVGDEIVMLGYQGTDEPERQSAIYMSAYSSMDTGLRAPLLGFYQGVNDFDLASHRTSYFDARKGKFVGEFEVVTESGSVPIEDYIKDKASIDIDTYRLMPSTTVINTGRDESALLSVVHQTGKVSEIISKPTDGFYILADFYDLNGKPFSGASFEIGDEITSQLFKDLKASRVVLTLQKLVGVNQLKDLDKCAVTTVADGEGGTDGKGIKTVTAHYGLSASPSAEPTEWKDTPQVMTPEKRYLWSYETTVYTDNTKKDTAKHIIGVYGDSGKNGVDGYTAYLSPARITLDTDSNGMVPNAKIKDAKAVIHVINGSNEISIGDINAVSLEAKGCTAVTDTVTIGARRYMCVKLNTIESVTDESGTYTNPLSTVDVTVTLNSGAVLVARMEVAINLHKVMATLKVEQNKITQRVTATETATEQLSNGVATLNTRVTELQTADGQILAQVKTVKDTVDGHTDSISQLAVRQGEIALSVKEASAPRNLLTGTAFRFDKDFTQNNVDYPCHVSETERYKGTNSVVIDVNEANAVYSGIILKSLVISPGISYTFSFLSKTVAGHEPDVFYYEVQAFKKDGSQSVKYRLAGGNIHRSEEWARTTSTFVTAEDVNYIKVIIFINKSGKAYIARPMLEEGDKYTGWTLSVDDDIKAVQGAGVNLNKERIELNGRTVFIGSDGNELAVFDNGKIEANLIDAKKIVATGIQAQTIDAKNAVFKNLTVEGDSTFKGTINAKSGNIAGFNIESNVLKNIVEENSPIAGSSIIINDKFSGIFSGIGTDVVPATSGYRVAAAFESTSQNNSMNVAARFIASGASVENVALLIPNGVIKGFRRYFRVVDANTTLKNTDSTILVRNNDLAITLPANCEDGQEYTIYLSSVHMTLTASGNDNIGLVTKNGGLSFSLIRQKTYGFDNEVMRISMVYDRIQQVWMVSRDIAK